MSTSARRLRLLYLLLLAAGLILILQFPGDPAYAAAPQATTISLHMTNPSCVQVADTSGTCSLRIHDAYAVGSDTSFSRLELLVDGKLRVYMPGFFETFAYFIDTMVPGGLRVPCGRPNAAGDPNYGNQYLVTANAYMTDGTSTSNSMNVFCPAADIKTYLPLTRK